ncbi:MULTISPECIES: hypothetical protein [Burkholderia]|uniref:hypothetical protein n=1 Tax=Burkholderia TaxID=32008 RepID=UPI001583BD57|nr:MULTISPECIES: hypothetical protein [Burkholderia]
MERGSRAAGISSPSARIPELVADDPQSYRIWAIDHDGGLIIGEEIDKMGHPCLTGFMPARIAGELKRTSTGWTINSKSGRYSGDYRNVDELLINALLKFKTIFNHSSEKISIYRRKFPKTIAARIGHEAASTSNS